MIIQSNQPTPRELLFCFIKRTQLGRPRSSFLLKGRTAGPHVRQMIALAPEFVERSTLAYPREQPCTQWEASANRSMLEPLFFKHTCLTPFYSNLKVETPLVFLQDERSLRALKNINVFFTTFSSGYLGSHNDEERSEMRYVM